MADQRCPMCGKLNPEDLENCLFCDARLKPLVANTPSYPEFNQTGKDPTEQKKTEGSKKPISSWLMSLVDRGEQAPDNTTNQSKGNEEFPTSEYSQASAANETEREFREWLAGLRNQTNSEIKPETTSSPDLEPTPGDPGQDSRAISVPEQPLIQGQEQEEETIPEWLSRLGEESDGQRGEEASKPIIESTGVDGSTKEENTPSGNIPEWIQVLEPKADIQAGEDEHLPEWLSLLPSIPAVESASESSGEFKEPGNGTNRSDQAYADNMDWLSQLKSSLGTTTGGENPQIESERTGTTIPGGNPPEQFPALISEGEPADASSAGLPGKAIQDNSGNPPAAAVSRPAEEVPDWLASLEPEQKEMETNGDETGQGSLKTSDLPSWVQALRPVESVISSGEIPGSDENQREETRGPLAGLQGILPSTPWLVSIRKPQADPLKLQVNNTQQRYAAQLEKMIMGEGQGQARKIEGVNPSRFLRLAISVILIAAVILPIVLGGNIMPEARLYPAEWLVTNQTIDEIPPGAPLLLVFDYEPALAGELEATGASVIQHLLFRGSRLALISTNPTGPALGEQFLKTTQSTYLETGLLYTNLGYLPGGSTGISHFAKEPTKAAELNLQGDPAWQTPALQGVSQLSDFGAVIILTDNADTGRLWIEQTQNAIGDTPILMIISAQAEPMIRPYLDSGQIKGLVTGLVGGKVYEQTYATPGRGRVYWDSFGFGALAVEILIVVGSLWSVIQFTRGRKKE